MRHNELVIRLRKAIFGVFTQSHNTVSKEWHSNFLQNDPISTKMDVPSNAFFSGGGFEFECQHGDEECEGNIWHACTARLLLKEILSNHPIGQM